MELSYDPETEQLTITPDRRTVRMTFNRGTGRTSVWVNPSGLSSGWRASTPFTTSSSSLSSITEQQHSHNRHSNNQNLTRVRQTDSQISFGSVGDQRSTTVRSVAQRVRGRGGRGFDNSSSNSNLISRSSAAQSRNGNESTRRRSLQQQHQQQQSSTAQQTFNAEENSDDDDDDQQNGQNSRSSN